MSTSSPAISRKRISRTSSVFSASLASTSWRRFVFLLPAMMSTAEMSRIMRETRVNGGVTSTSRASNPTRSSSA